MYGIIINFFSSYSGYGKHRWRIAERTRRWVGGWVRRPNTKEVIHVLRKVKRQKAHGASLNFIGILEHFI